MLLNRQLKDRTMAGRIENRSGGRIDIILSDGIILQCENRAAAIERLGNLLANTVARIGFWHHKSTRVTANSEADLYYGNMIRQARESVNEYHNLLQELSGE